jgi:hypothetical protein
MRVRCEVELDIFSGMPNPHWELSQPQMDAFVRQLASLRRISHGELHGNLGYRGFIVQLRSGLPVQLRVQMGIVKISSDSTPAYAEDVGRCLERWLLNTGKLYLEADILRLVEHELP